MAVNSAPIGVGRQLGRPQRMLKFIHTLKSTHNGCWIIRFFDFQSILKYGFNRILVNDLRSLSPLRLSPTRPTEEIRSNYGHIFELNHGLPPRLFKTLFDKVVATILLTLSLPIFLLLKIAYIIEGILIPENKGPMFFLLLGR